MRLAIVGIALLGIALSTTAEAAPHHKRSHKNHYAASFGHSHKAAYQHHRKTHRRAANREYGGKVVEYLPHPPGCPRTAFCGCGAAYRIWGEAKRGLWQAAAWFRFPASHPAPGMAAVRSHHVFVLERHIEGNTWLVTDYNSGNHKSRLHVRSIAGYKIVNPNG